MITESNNSFLIDELVSQFVFEQYFQGAFMAAQLFSMRASARPRERLASSGGLSDLQEITETQDLPEEEGPVQQYEKDFVHIELGKKLPVSRKIIDDNEWNLVQELGVQLGFISYQTFEKRAAALFADAFTGATYLGEDSKALCHTAHTNVDGANSQGNKGTNSLNFAGIKTTRQLMRRFKNYGGDPLGIRPSLIVCPIETEEDGWEAIRSTGKPDTANNNANVYNGMFDMLVWDYLTDTNAWFMIDPLRMKQNLLWWWRVALEVMSDGNLMKRTKTIGVYARCSHGFRDWRWVYGNNPS